MYGYTKLLFKFTMHDKMVPALFWMWLIMKAIIALQV